MESIIHVTVDDMNMESVNTIIPNGYKNLSMSDAVAGLQPPETYILVSILEIHKKIEIKNGPRKRVIVREVSEDGTHGEKVSVSIFKNFASELDCLLKNTKTSQGQWMIICNATLSEYMGPDPEEYSRLFIQISSGNVNSKVWLLTERTGSVVPCKNDQPVAGTSCPSATAKNAPRRKSYTLLRNCTVGQKFNAFAVVSEIVKTPSLTSNGNLHMLIGIVDPSSPREEGGIKDLLLQIFCVLSEEAKDFLNGIEVGHVVRIRDMLMELFNGEVRAKLYNQHQLVYFPGGVDNDIVPKATISSYELSSEDTDMVESLRVWTAEHRKDFQTKKKTAEGGIDSSVPATASGRHTLEMHTLIKEINRPMVFHLWCEIFQMRSIHAPAESMLLLQVRDGTNTCLHFKKYDFVDTTQELMSESENYCQPGSETIDIFVKGKVNVPRDLEPGDVIFLRGVSCYIAEANSQDRDLSYFELTMEEGSVILKPFKHDSQVRKVRNMIRMKNDQLSESSEDTFCEEVAMSLKRAGFLDVHRSPKPSSVRSPNRINTQPVSASHVKSSIQPTKKVVQSLTPRLSSPPRLSQLPCSRPGSSRFGSPKLPSQTDSLESALRDISDLSGRKQREGDQSPLRKASSPLQNRNSPHNASRRRLSGNLIEDLDVSRIEFPPDLPSSTQLSPSRLPSQEERLCHPSVQNTNIGETAQTAHSSISTSNKTVNNVLDAIDEVAFTNNGQEESSPSNEPMGDNSELDALALSSCSGSNNIRDEDNVVVYEVSSSSEVLSETVIQCSEPTSHTKISSGGDSEEVRDASKLVNPATSAKSREANSLQRKFRPLLQNGDSAHTKRVNESKPLPTASRNYEEPKAVKRRPNSVPSDNVIRMRAVKNKALLTTECRQDVTYTTLRALLFEGKEGVLYLVPGIVKQIFVSTDSPCSKEECLDRGLCCHDWLWGICTDCGECFDSEELRKKFPAQEFANNRLPCTKCCQETSPSVSPKAKRNKSDSQSDASPSKKRLCSLANKSEASKETKLEVSPTRKTKSGDSKIMQAKTLGSDPTSLKASTSKDDAQNVSSGIVPFMQLKLWLKDPEDGSEILLSLGGDHAKQFFGIEPTFQWLFEKADDSILRLVLLLLQQKTLLWFGVFKAKRSSNAFEYHLNHTSLKMVWRHQGPRVKRFHVDGSRV